MIIIPNKVVSPKLTTFRVNAAAQTNTMESKKSLQRPPTPAVETICDSFVCHNGSPMLTSIYEENSSLVIEPISPGFLRPENQNKPRRSLPTVECNSSGHIVVSRRISQKKDTGSHESWIPIVFGENSEASPPPPAPDESPRAVAGIIGGRVEGFEVFMSRKVCSLYHKNRKLYSFAYSKCSGLLIRVYINM